LFNKRQGLWYVEMTSRRTSKYKFFGFGNIDLKNDLIDSWNVQLSPAREQQSENSITLSFNDYITDRSMLRVGYCTPQLVRLVSSFYLFRRKLKILRLPKFMFCIICRTGEVVLIRYIWVTSNCRNWLEEFCNITCWTQSLTFCLKNSSRCGAT